MCFHQHVECFHTDIFHRSSSEQLNHWVRMFLCIIFSKRNKRTLMSFGIFRERQVPFLYSKSICLFSHRSDRKNCAYINLVVLNNNLYEFLYVPGIPQIRKDTFVNLLGWSMNSDFTKKDYTNPTNGFPYWLVSAISFCIHL